MKRNIVAGAFLATVCATLAVSAGAASAKPAAATLTATPAVVTQTATAATTTAVSETFTGCGYQAATGTTIVINTPTAISFFGGNSDAAGCINLVHNGFIDQPGTYYVQAWQDNAHGKSILMATTTFVVN
jgi:hypothetical protein